MHNSKIANYESLKEKVIGLDLDKLGQQYAVMGDLNLEIANEYRLAESESEYTTEKFIGVDIGIK